MKSLLLLLPVFLSSCIALGTNNGEPYALGWMDLGIVEERAYKGRGSIFGGGEGTLSAREQSRIVPSPPGRLIVQGRNGLLMIEGPFSSRFVVRDGLDGARGLARIGAGTEAVGDITKLMGKGISEGAKIAR